MKNQWKSLLHFTKTERNGLILLLVLCMLFIFSSSLVSIIWPADPPLDFSSYEKDIAGFVATETPKEIDNQQVPEPVEPFNFDPNQATETELQQLGLPPKVIKNLLNYRAKGGRFFKKEDLKKIYGFIETDYQRLENFIQLEDQNFSQAKSNNFTPNPKNKAAKVWNLRLFDPNTTPLEELIDIGITQKAAGTIVKYRNKGGTFRKKEDLKKIFGISEADYEKLKSYINISVPTEPVSKQVAQVAKPYPEKSSTILIDINQSTAEDWQKIRGIGPGYSKRIIAWREKLGGFYTIKQVAETRGLPDSVFQKIEPQLQASPLLTKIPINQIQTKELQVHPYLNYKQANAIIKYRENHGPFQNPEDLKKVRALPAQTLEKILPYLSFD